MTYKVFLKDGQVMRATKVDFAPGWVVITTWSGELRLPAGEVVRIHNPNMEYYSRLAFFGGLMLFFVMVFLVAYDSIA